MADLEETQPVVEAEAPTPEVEGEKPTEPQAKPTVRTYTQEELDRAVGKGLETLNRQLSLTKAELQSHQKARELLQRQIKELEEGKFEDPEVLEGYRKTKKLEYKEQELQIREAEIENKIRAIQLHDKATELQQIYRVPREVLEVCQSEEQMEKIAKAFPKIEEEQEEKTVEAKPKKFDSNLPSGGGRELPAKGRDKIRAGWDALHPQ